MTAAEMLDRLNRSLPVAAADPWQEYLDLICDGGLEDATARGFTIRGVAGRIEVELPGGLMPQDYDRLAPLLNEDEKLMLAKGVLENLLQSLSWAERQTAMMELRQAHSSDDQWLVAMIQQRGFDAVVDEMKERLIENRRVHRPTRRRLMWVEHPVWHGADIRLLEYGQQRWHFRSDATNILLALGELERNKWRPVNLEPDAVQDIAKALRKKTRPHINWHAGADGQLSWEAM